MDLETVRNIGWLIVTAFALSGIVGAIYVYRYKIKANCLAVEKITILIQEIKEEKLPYCVTFADMEKGQTQQNEMCKQTMRDHDKQVSMLIERIETTIIVRLDKMDRERNESRKIQTGQREKRLIEFTKIATVVEGLSSRFEKIEKKLS